MAVFEEDGTVSKCAWETELDEVRECLREALRHIYYYDGQQKNVAAWDYWKRWCAAAKCDPSQAGRCNTTERTPA